MKFKENGCDFKYLIVNEKDRTFGLTVSSVGFQQVLPNSVYPSTQHPRDYYFHPDKGRVLSEYQIVYISKGRGVFSSLSTQETELTTGQAFFLFPGQWHSYCPSKDTGWNEYYIGFDGNIARQLIKHSFISPENQVLNVGLNEDLVYLFTTAIKVAKEDKIASQQCLAGILYHIIGTLLYLSQNRNFENKESIIIIEQAKVMMVENICRNIDVKDLSLSLGTSYSWFRKVFKEYTGYAPAQYFNELKLKRAKELLNESNLSIKEIAFELDFSSYEYFLSFFKKKMGVTPGEFRSAGRK